MTAHTRLTHALIAAVMSIGLFTGGLALAGAAWAHAALISSDPAANAELPQQPPRVSATFNESMQSQFAAMTVVGPDGGQWADGEVSVDGAVIGVAVKAGGPAGTYTVNYRATSADGHVVTGSWAYQVLTADKPVGSAPETAAQRAPTTTAETSTAAPAQDSSDGIPVWPFVVAVTAIVAAGAIWAVRRRS